MLLSCGLCYKTTLKKNLFNFELVTKLPKIVQFAKNWTVLRLTMSCQLEYVWIHKVKWCLGGLNYKIVKKTDPIFRNFSKIAPRSSKNRQNWIILAVVRKTGIWEFWKCQFFWKYTDFWRFGGQLKIEQVFSMQFYSITHMKVAYMLFFVKQL